jgi:hypothetical protein
MFSGGINSWAMAKRVIAEHGPQDMTLLFADTLMEDEDLYRFLDDSQVNLGVPIIRIAEGRTPWQVFFDERFLGNSRVDPCSRTLKRRFLEAYRNEHFDVADTIVYVGIDWTEMHRLDAIQAGMAPWRVEAPLCDKPYLTKAEMLRMAQDEGLSPPRLYERGFHHNNCGGFCIKAGQAQFAALLREFPERYAYHEGKEQELREYLGKDVSILKDRRGGEAKTLTMAALRERIQGGGQIDMFDWGGCGCFVDDGRVLQQARPVM